MFAFTTVSHRVATRSADPRRQLQALGPIDQLRAGHLWRRIPQLLLGLAVYALSMALMVRGTLGVMPWDVLHQGVARHVPLTLGQTVVVTSVLVLLLWIPLRQPPGLGTLANGLLIGAFLDPVLAVLVQPQGLPARIAYVVLGVVVNAVATAMYIGAQLGPGPRDGLMTGLARRTGWSLRLVRTGLEVVVVLVGWALGGALGVATVLYALTIGPVTQAVLPHLVVPLEVRPGGRSARAGARHTLTP